MDSGRRSDRAASEGLPDSPTATATHDAAHPEGATAGARRWARHRLLWLSLLGAGAAGLFAERLSVMAKRLPIGNDESIYSLMAWGWAGRIDPPSVIPPHRIRGIGGLLFPAVAATERITLHRAWFALIGMVLLVMVYLIGARFLGRWVAAWTAALFGLSWLHVFFSMQLLPDVPAAAGMATVFYLHWRFVRGAGPGERLSRLWLVGAAIGGTFYLNPAHAGLAGIVVTLDLIMHRPRDLVRPEPLIALGATAAAMMPYFVKVTMDHGSPFHHVFKGFSNSKELGGSIPGRNPGYVDYSDWFFESSGMFGPVVGAAVVAGTVLLLFAAIRGWPVPRRDARLLAMWLVIPGAAMALLFHAEERYEFVAYPAAFLAVGVLARAFTLWRPPWMRLGAGLIVLGLLPWWGVNQYGVASARAERFRRNEGFVNQVARELGGLAITPCRAYVRYATQFSLLSTCRSTRYRGRESQFLDSLREAPPNVYIVWFERGRSQPDYMVPFLAEHAVVELEIPSKTFLRTATIYRLVPFPDS